MLKPSHLHMASLKTARQALNPKPSTLNRTTSGFQEGAKLIHWMEEISTTLIITIVTIITISITINASSFQSIFTNMIGITIIIATTVPHQW